MKNSLDRSRQMRANANIRRRETRSKDHEHAIAANNLAGTPADNKADSQPDTPTQICAFPALIEVRRQLTAEF